MLAFLVRFCRSKIRGLNVSGWNLMMVRKMRRTSHGLYVGDSQMGASEETAAAGSLPRDLDEGWLLRP